MRNLIILLLVLVLGLPVAFAQPFTVLDPALLASQRSATQFLLQAAPGAFAAYSVRQLNATNFGPCLSVQRSSDNTTNSFNYAGGIVDTNALLSFVGAGNNGYVTAWYDQSGNARHLGIYIDTNTCPLIVSNGVLLVGSNNLPALRWRAGQTLTTASAITISNSISTYAVGARPWTTARFAFAIGAGYNMTTGFALLTTGGAFNDWPNLAFLNVGNGYNAGRLPRAFGPYGAIADNTWHLTDAVLGTNGSGVWLDNLSIASASTNAAIPALTFGLNVGGNPNTSDYWDGDIAEIVLYNTAHDSNTQAIVRANLNAAYKLY